MKKIVFPLILSLVFLTGCTKEIVVIPPKYPKLKAPLEVPRIKAKVKKRNGKVCLWMKGHNTNLCDEDLVEIVSLIKKLRINEKTCQRMVKEYNNFVLNKTKK